MEALGVCEGRRELEAEGMIGRGADDDQARLAATNQRSLEVDGTEEQQRREPEAAE